MSTVFVKTYPAPPINEREILRFAGCQTADEPLRTLLNGCLAELQDKLSYTVCYTQLPVIITDGLCDFGTFSVRSHALATRLWGCESVLLFGASVGIEVDRAIAKYGRLSPSKGLLMQAIGAERIETLCDLFCADMQAKIGGTHTARFSAGYGDLPLETQKEIFSVLGCEKRIGVYLNDSYLMSPSKSVTAFVGIKSGFEDTVYASNPCVACRKTDCEMRCER